MEWESHSMYGIKSRSIKDETRESTTQNQCFSVQHKQSEKINDNLGKTSATFATDWVYGFLYTDLLRVSEKKDH